MFKAFFYLSLILLTVPAIAGSMGQAPGDNGDFLINNNTQYGAVTPSQAANNLGQLVINLATHGLPTGNDDTTAINNLLQQAQSLGYAVYAPAGDYKHAGVITVDGVPFYGDGFSTIMESTNVTGGTSCGGGPCNSVILTGNAPSLKNMTVFQDWAGARQSNNDSTDILVLNANTYEVSSVSLGTSASTGIAKIGSSYGSEHDIWIANTLADGDYTTGASHDISISNLHENNTGDDCISVVSYNSDSAPVYNITESNNQCTGGLKRGFTVVGGHDISIHGGNLTNIYEACLYIASEASFNTAAVNGVSIDGVIENNCGNPSQSYAANMVFGRSGYLTSNVTIKGVVGTALNATGMQIGESGDYTSNIIVADNNFTGIGSTTSGAGIYAYGVTNLDVHNNNVSNYSAEGFTTDQGNDNSGYLKLTNNNFNQVSTGTAGALPAILVAQSGFTKVAITGNTQTNGSSTVSGLISNDVAGALIENNKGDNTSLSIGTQSLLIDGNTQNIATQGNVAIGTTSPASGYLFDIENGTVSRMQVGRGGGAGSYPNDALQIYQDGDGHIGQNTSILHINSGTTSLLDLNDVASGNIYMAGGGGKVGIGTTTPASKLSVVGLGTTSPGTGGGYNCVDSAGDFYVKSSCP